MKRFYATLLPLAMLAAGACSEGTNSPNAGTPSNQEASPVRVQYEEENPRVTFDTEKKNIRLEVNAALKDRNNVWIDLNGNGKKDEGEQISRFQDPDQTPAVQYQAKSQTITIYGKLTYLNLEGNDITALEVTTCPSLEKLWAPRNAIKALDLSRNTLLRQLIISDNQIEKIDLEPLPLLREFWCDINKISKLDVSKNKELRTLVVSKNALTTLDITKNTNLQDFRYNINPMKVDISQNLSLRILECSVTEAQELDLSKHLALEWLSVSGNKMKALDLSKNSKLTKLNCHLNNLTTLDLSKNTELEMIDCSANKLTSLDFSKNKSLIYIDAYSNLFDVEALHQLYNSLRDVRHVIGRKKDFYDYHKRLNVSHNPGTWEASSQVALNKGWIVEEQR